MTLRPTDHLAVTVNLAGLSRAGADWKLDATRTRAWPDLDLWVLVSGDVTLQAAGVLLPLRPGSCLLMQGGRDYHIVRTSSRPLVNYWVHFDFAEPTTGARVPHATLQMPWVERWTQPDSLVFNLLERVRAARHARDAGRWLSAALLEIESAAPHLHDVRSAEVRPVWVDRFCTRVRDAPQKAHSVADLAKQAGYDPAYVCRVFTRHVGVSPKQFITQTRMRAAQALLRDSAMPIAGVAAAVGYRDAHFFSRHFRVMTGMSASAYRG